MALKCSVCGRAAQKKYNFCPSCGAPIKRKSALKKCLIIILPVLIIAAIVAGCILLLKPPADNARILALTKLGLKIRDVEKELGKDYKVNEENRLIYNGVEIVPGVIGSMEFVLHDEYIDSWRFKYYIESESQNDLAVKVFKETFTCVDIAIAKDTFMTQFKGLDESINGSVSQFNISCKFHEFEN